MDSQTTFIKQSIRGAIELFDRMFEEYKNIYIKDNKFPIFIMNTGDELFMSNMSDIGDAKVELYDRIPRMVLSVKDMGIDTDQLTRPGNKTRVGVTKDKKLKMGWTQSRRVPITLVLGSRLFFSNLNEYLEFIEYYITIITNYSLVYSFYFNGVKFNGLIKPLFDYTLDTNYDLGFDSVSRNRTIDLNFEIDIQMPAYNIYKIKNLKSNDLGFNQDVILDSDYSDEDNDGSCNGNKESGGIEKFAHTIYINTDDKEGFVSRTIIPKENDK